MFHEFRDLITELKQNDAHFSRLFDKHNDLDQEIKNLENNPVVGAHSHDEIEQKKREKLHLKDEMYHMLQRIDKERNG